MREIKLKIDKKLDIETIIKDYLKEININEFYERKLKSEGRMVYVFVYEYSYTKYYPLNKYNNADYVTTTNTVIASSRPDSTGVAIVLASDDKNEGCNRLSLRLRDYGFYAA